MSERFNEQTEQGLKNRFERAQAEHEQAQARIDELQAARRVAQARIDELSNALVTVPISEVASLAVERANLAITLDALAARLPLAYERARRAEGDYKQARLDYGNCVAERWGDKIRDKVFEFAFTPSGDRARRLKLGAEIEALKLAARAGI